MISVRDLDAWLAWLEPAEADRALLAAGLRADELSAVHTHVSRGMVAPVIGWTLGDAEWAVRRGIDARASAQLLPNVTELRLAVSTAAPPIEVLRRLLRVPQVASAFVAVERPAASLRRRPWHWPLRVGLIGFPEGAADAVMATIRAGHSTLPNLLEVTRIEDEPGAVDVAIIEEPLLAVVPQLVDHKLVANALLVLHDPVEQSPVTEALLATARAATGASASAMLPPQEVAGLLTGLVAEASHANGFDVALTTAAERGLLLWAEPDAMMRSGLPQIALRTARGMQSARAAAAPAESAALEAAEVSMTNAAAGAFVREAFEATDIAGMTRAVESSLEAVVEERWCQVAAHALHNGANEVRFFIGPREAGAQAAPVPLDESQLPWEEEDADAFRLTILFIPVVPDAVAQEAELELPRFGRSEDAVFTLDMRLEEPEITARILVLFRNRILQTAVLRGRLAEVPKLVQVVALVPSLNGLDDRRPFDLTLFANHAGGRRMLTRHSDGQTQISAPGGVPAIAERIATAMGLGALDRRRLTKGLRSPAARELLVALALEGRDLFDTLSGQLGKLSGASRIQVVTADSSWVLPLEVAYEREAPDDDAEICANFLADPATCTGKCTVKSPRESVCPNAFWGLSKTIERHRYDPDRDPTLAAGYHLVGSGQPRRGHRDLTVGRALLGASTRVRAADSDATVAALGPHAAAVVGWDAWETSLKDQPTQLLVLLPHTDYGKATLEIGKTTLARGRIEARYVTGDHDEHPIVILFGCRTTGTGGDPAGFAERFALKGASAVFHSAADMKNDHATELARRLTACLTNAGRAPRMLSDALAEFRRDAVRDGFVFALAISALGDADWRT